VMKFTDKQLSAILSAAAAGELQAYGSSWRIRKKHEMVLVSCILQVAFNESDTHKASLINFTLSGAFDRWAKYIEEIRPEVVLAWMEEIGVA